MLTGAAMTVKLVDTLQLVLAVSKRTSPALLAHSTRDLIRGSLGLCTLACDKVDLIVKIATPSAVVEIYNCLLTFDVRCH